MSFVGENSIPLDRRNGAALSIAPINVGAAS